MSLTAAKVEAEAPPRLAELLDMFLVQKLADANYAASRMPIGIIDARDGAVLVGVGWQDICTRFHRVHPRTLERCRESDRFIQEHLSASAPCEYICRNGLRDIGVPILAGGAHLATLFLGQFFYEGESPDRDFFVQQARDLGFAEGAYLDALERVPVFPRATVENILAYNAALARFLGDLAEASLRRRADELALRRANERLREADRAKDEFLCMASHELRTPLTAMRLQTDTLTRFLKESRLQDGRLFEKLSAMDVQLRRLQALVSTLLDASQIHAGRLDLERSEVDLAEVARDVLRRLGRDADRAGTVLRLRARPARGSWDRLRLEQVVTNLVGNAIQYGGGRPVDVAVEERDGVAVLSVRDEGIGISRESQARIFERFKRAAGAQPASGMGLGLWLARQVVEAHGGDISVESAPGSGATFTVTLPRAAEPGPVRC